jgi:outer membrane protein
MKTLIRQTGLMLVLGLLALAAPLRAQEFRLGFVSLDRIIKEADPAKKAQVKLEQEFSKREKELQEQGATLKAMADKLEREAPTLSDNQRAARQKQVVEQDRDFQRKRREFQEDLNARRNEELQQVFERANKVVKQVADAEKYDLILQEAVYVNPKHDITDKVIKALNAATVK